MYIGMSERRMYKKIVCVNAYFASFLYGLFVTDINMLGVMVKRIRGN